MFLSSGRMIVMPVCDLCRIQTFLVKHMADNQFHHDESCGGFTFCLDSRAFEEQHQLNPTWLVGFVKQALSIHFTVSKTWFWDISQGRISWKRTRHTIR